MRTYLWLTKRGTKTYFANNLIRYTFDAHSAAYRKGNEDLMQTFYEEFQWDTPSVLQTLKDARDLVLKDPCDRIYAFMELSQDPAYRNTIRPNYFAPYLEVYRQFAVTYVQSTNSVSLLDFVCHNDETLTESPSWVPRWDIQATSLAFVESSALQPRVPRAFGPMVTRGGELRVRGVIIDTLIYVSELLDPKTTTAETIRHLWNCVMASAIGNPYTRHDAAGPDILVAFLDALSACGYIGEYSQWAQARKSFAANLRSEHAYTHTDQSPDAACASADDHDGTNLFFHHLRNMTKNCRFTLTGRGYMGLAPSMVQKGDRCGIIFGAKLPVYCERQCKIRVICSWAQQR
jgi:hypothetical protein